MRIISGLFKNRPLVTPKGLTTRPTSNKLRESLFNICQSYIQEARFLDLFAGSGAVGLEALSRGAKHATFIENDRTSAKCIRENLATLESRTQADVICGDVFAQMQRLNKAGMKFDIIYADPPYEAEFSEKVVSLVDASNLLADGGMLFVEDSRRGHGEYATLTTLKLLSRREMGRSTLLQFQKGEKK